MALVGRFLGEPPAAIRTLGLYGGGAYRENFEYRLPTPPRPAGVAGAFSVVPRDVARIFPQDEYLPKGAVGYAGYPLKDAAGRVAGIIAIISRQPITEAALAESVLKIFAVRPAAELERRAHEEALAASEANYRAIYEAAEDAIFILDYERGAILDANAKACSTYGYTRAELRRVGAGDISGHEPPYTDEDMLRLIAEVRAGRGPLRFEWRRRNRDGSLGWDEATLKKVDIAGQPHILAMTREITERKSAVEALRASEEQYRAIFNATADSLVLRDAEFSVVDVNPAYEAMSGRRREEALGRDDLTMSPPELNAHVKQLHARALAGERVVFEAVARRKDGSRFNIETRGVPILHKGQPHVLYIGRDITARKTEEELLRANEEQFRSEGRLALQHRDARRADPAQGPAARAVHRPRHHRAQDRGGAAARERGAVPRHLRRLRGRPHPVELGAAARGREPRLRAHLWLHARGGAAGRLRRQRGARVHRAAPRHGAAHARRRACAAPS